jgi:hypothetical protein
MSFPYYRVSRARKRLALACGFLSRYGMPAVRAFLRNGVPPDVIKTLGS